MPTWRSSKIHGSIVSLRTDKYESAILEDVQTALKNLKKVRDKMQGLVDNSKAFP